MRKCDGVPMNQFTTMSVFLLIFIHFKGGHTIAEIINHRNVYKYLLINK